MNLTKRDNPTTDMLLLAVKNIGAELANAFPETAFTVSSAIFGQGPTITVAWSGDPSQSLVDQITQKYSANWAGNEDWLAAFGEAEYVIHEREDSAARSDQSSWRCPHCFGSRVMISLPAWYRETAGAGVTFVEADTEASIAGWYCEDCNQSGSGRPLPRPTKISEVRALYPEMDEIDTGGGAKGLCHPCDDGGHILITVNSMEAPTDADRMVEVGVYDAETNQIGEVEDIEVEALESWIDSTLLARSKRTA